MTDKRNDSSISYIEAHTLSIAVVDKIIIIAAVRALVGGTSEGAGSRGREVVDAAVVQLHE